MRLPRCRSSVCQQIPDSSWLAVLAILRRPHPLSVRVRNQKSKPAISSRWRALRFCNRAAARCTTSSQSPAVSRSQGGSSRNPIPINIRQMPISPIPSETTGSSSKVSECGHGFRLCQDNGMRGVAESVALPRFALSVDFGGNARNSVLVYRQCHEAPGFVGRVSQDSARVWSNITWAGMDRMEIR